MTIGLIRGWWGRRRRRAVREQIARDLGFASVADWYAWQIRQWVPGSPGWVVGRLIGVRGVRRAEFDQRYGHARVVVRLRLRDRLWPPHRRRIEERVRETFYDAIPLGAAARIGLEIR